MLRRFLLWLAECIPCVSVLCQRAWTNEMTASPQNEPLNSIVNNAVSFYEKNYRLVDVNLALGPNDKRYLGDRAAKTCRFCGRSTPDVTFKQETHALPEAVGNKSLITHYECDVCNDKFGGGIDTEFGKWSKPLRTFYQVRGKSGVPTLKREGQTGWRIELEQDGFIFQQHVDNPVVSIDEANDQISIEVPIDQHVPIAAFKAFVKMALSLLPASEVQNFVWTFRWLQEKVHSRPFHPDMARLWYTFAPGPRPFEGVTTLLFIRRDDSAEAVPYCTFVVAFGNECYQIFVPCPEKDQPLRGTDVKMPILPNPYHWIERKFGKATKPLFYDLSGTEPVRGAIKRIFHAQLKPPKLENAE